MNPLVDYELSPKYQPASPVIIGKNTTSFSEFISRIAERAAFFFEQGIKSNDYAAVLWGNKEEFIINIAALWKLNAIPILLNTRLLNSEITELIGFAECKFIITDKPITGIENCTIISELKKPGKNENPNLHSPKIENTALVLFTSGSTGKPKGVELTFSNLIASAKAANAFINFRSDDRWLVSLPFYHIGGFSIITRALLYGSSLIIPDIFSASGICSAMKSQKPTLCSLVSTQLKKLIDEGCSPNKEMRKVLLGGGFIEDDLLSSALSKGWRIIKVYGSSETSSMVTALDCDKRYKLDSAGKPLPGVEIIITDEENLSLPVNMPGEILVKAPSVSKGYLNNPEENNLKFREGYYHSGDIGSMDEEGYLFIHARRTDLIISGGENINPYEVEKVILMYPSISEAAVFPVKDETWGQVPAAAVTLNGPGKIELEELKDFLRDKIASYKIPKHLFILNELPKSPLGKIQKEKLQQLLK